MPYCGNCGANLADGATVCANCGRLIGAPVTHVNVSSYAGTAIGPNNTPVQLAEWLPRAGGYLIDVAILIGGVIVGLIFIALKVQFLGLLVYLAVAAVGIWFSIQVGQTGQSPGMRVVGLKAVSTRTGEPIGGGMGFLRSICHFVDNLICYVGWIFPLWDKNRQTIADKIVGTVVITVPKRGFSLTP